MGLTNGVTKEHKKQTVVKSVCEFFDEEGTLCQEEFTSEVLKLHAIVSKGQKSD